MTSVRLPRAALMAARLQVMVDLPTPPFWLNTTRISLPTCPPQFNDVAVRGIVAKAGIKGQPADRQCREQMNCPEL